MAEPTTSSTDCHLAGCSLHRAALQPRHVEQVVTSAFSCARLLGDRLRASRPAAAAQRRRGERCSDSASPISAVSGVRTSCEMRRQQRVAQPLGFHLHHAPAAPRRRSAPAPARSRSARASVSSCCACSGISSQRGLRGLERQHAAHAHRRLQRHVVPGLGRQRVGAEPGRLAVVERPSRRRWHRQPAARGAGGMHQPVVGIGHQHAAPGRRKLRCTAASPELGHLRRVSSAPDRSRANSNSDCARRSRLRGDAAPESAGRR